MSIETMRIDQVPAPPRRIKLIRNRFNLTVMRLASVPHMAIGIGSLLWLLAHFYASHYGTLVSADVDRKMKTTDAKGKTLYYIDYHFDLSGKRHDKDASLTKYAYEQLKRGDRFDGQAAILWGYPFFVMPEDWERVGILPMLGISLFCNLMALLSIFAFWWMPARVRFVARCGEAAEGRVSRRHEFKSGNGVSYRISYEFATLLGEVNQGRCVVPKEVYESVEEGDKIIVLYDPRQPTRNMSYEYGDFAISAMTNTER